MSTDPPGDAHTHGGARHAHAHGHRPHAHDFYVPDMPEAVDIFDTILRDGSQQEGLSLTVDDKLRVAEQLDHLGVAGLLFMIMGFQSFTFTLLLYATGVRYGPPGANQGIGG